MDGVLIVSPAITALAVRAPWRNLLKGPAAWLFFPHRSVLDIGAARGSSVKDVIAHVTAYEQRLVNWLQSALRGEFPAPSVLDTPGLDERNAKAHALSPAEVRAEAARNFQALLEALEQFTDEDLTQPECTEWFMKPYWTRAQTIGEAVLNLTVEHYAEHSPSLTAWANQ